MEFVEKIMNMQYGELFEPSIERIRDRYLELVKIYHPDVWGDSRADEMISHITKLKNQAIQDIESGIWRQEGKISLEMKRGGWLGFEYSSSQEFELGQIFIGKDKILYLIEEEYQKYFDNALKWIKDFSFANDSMKQEFIPILPRLIRQGICKNNNSVIILEKAENEYPLSEILNRLGNVMEAKHVAWIISRLCNICCYLQYRSISHNGLTLDNLFVNPIQHTISLYGGWWYATVANERMLGTTPDVYEMMSDRCQTLKLGECRTDQEMVHEIAKILLNNKSLVFKAGEITDIPESMAGWIRAGTCGCAFEEFEKWNKTLDDSWGKREFVDLHVSGIC